MNYIDMILDNIQAHFDLDDLDDIFGIEKFGDSIEVTAPNGTSLTITDTKLNFLSLHTAYIGNPYRRIFEADHLSTSEATNILTGFIAANL